MPAPIGTTVGYQGYVCKSVSFRRSLGMRPDSTSVVMPLPRIDSVSFQPGEEGPASHEPDSLVVPGAEVSVALRGSGALTLAEAVPVREYVTDDTIDGLFVKAVERFSADNALDFARIMLTDEREWWELAVLPPELWEINQLDAQGRALEETHQPTGASSGRPPWTVAALVTAMVRLFRYSPEVVTTPESWTTIQPRFRFGRYVQVVRALNEILEQFPARMSLHMDRTVGFYEEGDGELGTPGGGSGAFRNSEPIPAELVESRGGQGHVRGVNFGTLPDRVMVTGGERIASVRIDGWHPVILIDGEPRPLLDEFGRMLGRSTGPTPEQVNWLHRFVLRPEALQASPELRGRDLEALKRDAYRLYRLPGADTYNRHLLPLLPRAETQEGVRLPPEIRAFTWRQRDVQLGRLQGDPNGELVESERVLALEAQRRAALLAGEAEEAEHLLVDIRLEARRAAEQSGLVSQQVEEYNDARAKVEFLKGKLVQSIGSTGRAQISAGATIPALSLLSPIGSNLAEFVSSLGLPDIPILPAETVASSSRIVQERIQRAGKALELLRVQRWHDTARAASERARTLSFAQAGYLEGLNLLKPALLAEESGLAQPAAIYRAELSRMTAAAAAGGKGPRSLGIEGLYVRLAETLLEAGDAIRSGNRNPEAQIQAAFALGEQITEARIQHARRVLLLGEGRRADYLGRVDFVNEPSAPIPTARVESASSGLVRFASPVGWLDDPRVSSLQDTALRPRKVSVTFGTKMEPRRPGKRNRPSAGLSSAADPGFPDSRDVREEIIPPQFEEIQDEDFGGEEIRSGPRKHLGYFTRAYAQQGATLVPADVVETSAGGLAVAVARLGKPDVELIRLDGTSNQEELDQRARDVATAKLGEILARQDLRRIDVLGVHLANCDGLVSGVEIETREKGHGFRTRIGLGRALRPFGTANKTILRRSDYLEAPQPTPPADVPEATA